MYVMMAANTCKEIRQSANRKCKGGCFVCTLWPYVIEYLQIYFEKSTSGYLRGFHHQLQIDEVVEVLCAEKKALNRYVLTISYNDLPSDLGIVV